MLWLAKGSRPFTKLVFKKIQKIYEFPKKNFRQKICPIQFPTTFISSPFFVKLIYLKFANADAAPKYNQKYMYVRFVIPVWPRGFYQLRINFTKKVMKTKVVGNLQMNIFCIKNFLVLTSVNFLKFFYKTNYVSGSRLTGNLWANCWDLLQYSTISIANPELRTGGARCQRSAFISQMVNG